MPLTRRDERADARTMETAVGLARVHRLDSPPCGVAVEDPRSSAPSTPCGQAAGNPEISTIPTVHHARGDRDVYRRNGGGHATALPPHHLDRDVSGDPSRRGAPVCRL